MYALQNQPLSQSIKVYCHSEAGRNRVYELAEGNPYYFFILWVPTYVGMTQNRMNYLITNP